VADSADGLAVTDPTRRLEVMRDSQTGAYGVMAIAVVILLKTLALGSLTVVYWQGWGLLMATVWGRWGQLLAIALYPYLRETGKGAMHRSQLQWLPDLTFATAIALGGTLAIGAPLGLTWPLMGVAMLVAMVISWAVGFWFAQKFGGHTGDTYGAVVEWSEVLILLALNLLQNFFPS
jgi:adenosylcobinamide-GDP ribazoletransferase